MGDWTRALIVISGCFDHEAPKMNLEAFRELAGMATGFLREDRLGSVTAALRWGLPRCHSDAARAIFPALVLLLGDLNATVLPVEHLEGDLPAVDFRITVSRILDSGAADRRRFAVRSTATAAVPDLTTFFVDDLQSLKNPWTAAAEIIGKILHAIASDPDGASCAVD